MKFKLYLSSEHLVWYVLLSCLTYLLTCYSQPSVIVKYVCSKSRLYACSKAEKIEARNIRFEIRNIFLYGAEVKETVFTNKLKKKLIVSK